MPRTRTAPAIPSTTSAPSANPFQASHRQQPEVEQPTGPLWIAPEDAAAQLGITIEALKKRARQGLLGFREGGRWRFSTADLKRYTAGVETRHLRSLPR